MPLPLHVTRVTHSCLLVHIGETVLLTDPWFSEKFGYHPGEPVALRPQELPELSAVLVSHNHYDHADFGAFAAYPDHTAPVIGARTIEEPARAAGSAFSSASPPAELAAWCPVRRSP
jgi:L-ascorbate metabolism protein UlaG (beta-lactamase superfamily)